MMPGPLPVPSTDRETVRGGWLCPQWGLPASEAVPIPPCCGTASVPGRPPHHAPSREGPLCKFWGSASQTWPRKALSVSTGLLRTLRSLVCPLLARLRRPGRSVSLRPPPGVRLSPSLWSLSWRQHPENLTWGHVHSRTPIPNKFL